MKEIVTTVTSKGQVTIPVEIRRALGLKPHDRVAFALTDGVATVRPAESVVDRLAGSVKWPGGPIDFKKLRKEFEREMARNALRGSGLEEKPALSPDPPSPLRGDPGGSEAEG
jgi:AbrB family looped-hinge helix DNA binding protein